ncbi:hypothetical protein KIN20_029138 [Parelaphostrongylus tenuis]|uniref:C2H2-type domain-containing protein n=1 Tax=Parelaphostrongylus tenuis TaxID=148309 RepID=A0AAD5WFM4_PARTN|nr:hypothetical protein KIN20_029138 [Parelaphostrongylus tenuis]
MDEEVVLEQGDCVEEFIVEEQLTEDDMAESLVALSRSGEFSHRSGRECVAENVDPRRRQQRILRRFGASHQPSVEQQDDLVESSQLVVEEYEGVVLSVLQKDNEEVNYYHHGRLIRKYGRCDIFTPKRFPCRSPGCHERLGTLERLCEHMFQVHGAPTDIKRKLFENEAQFDGFLRELESRGGNFRMSRGNKTVKEGIVQYFRCNRIYSIAKDKAMRIVDDINAGANEAVKDITHPMEPFAKETSTRPYLRTEEACTAFFRKTYLNDGSVIYRIGFGISVIRCLQRESLITNTTIIMMRQLVQTCNERIVVKSEKAAEASGQLKTLIGSQQLFMSNGGEDHNVAGNLVNRNDDNDCEEHLDPADEIPEEWVEGGEGVDLFAERTWRRLV